MATRDDDNTFVYLVAAGPFLKIGISANPVRRAAELNLPFSATVVAVVGHESRGRALAMERELHTRFASSRARGEWFNDSVAIRDWLASNRGVAPSDRDPFQAIIDSWSPELVDRVRERLASGDLAPAGCGPDPAFAIRAIRARHAARVS